MRKCRYSKTCVKLPLSKNNKRNLFKTNFHLLQVKIGAFCILTTIIKLPFVIEIFFLSIFDLPFYTGFTVVYFFYVKGKLLILSSLICSSLYRYQPLNCTKIL